MANDFIRGANSASVDVGRSAEQSTEMFRSLRSVAMQLDQGLAEMEELDALLDDEDSSPYDTPAMSGPANLEAEPTGGRSETKAGAGRSVRKARSLVALRQRMVQQVQLLFNELDRHGGAERLVASASRGAGSADCADCDDFPAGAAESLCETSLSEMSLDEVCEALAARGLDMYIGLFQRESLDGARLSELDEPAILEMGLDRALCSAILRGHL